MIKCTFFGSVFEILSPILTSRVSINKPYGLILTNAFKTLYRENFFYFFLPFVMFIIAYAVFTNVKV